MICKPCACDADWQTWELGELTYPKCGEDDCDGHRSCIGCDCQHRPVKIGQINAG